MRVLGSRFIALAAAAVVVLGACGSNVTNAPGASQGAASQANGGGPSGAVPSSGIPGATGGTIGGTGEAVAIAAGSGHACALLSNGGVMCWGGNWRGQLGNGTVAPNGDTTMSPPAFVLGLTSGVHAIAAEGDTTCALMDGGTVKCWGSGAVGNGATAPVPAPVDVVGLAGASKIFTSSASYADGICAIAGGVVKCWGRAFNSDIAVSIPGITNATAVALANDHSCALLDNGAIKCWGTNGKGQLGNGSTTDSATPVDVVGLTSAATAVIAGNGFSCALMTSGGLKCWGASVDGTSGTSAIPVDVAAFPSGASSIFEDAGAICGIMSGGDVTCLRDPGQLATLKLKVKALALNGSAELCALTIDNNVVCYSYTGAGGWPVVQGLVASAAAGQSSPPAAGNVSAISLGNQHLDACVITTTGGVKCWGAYPGNGTNSSATAVDVLGLTSGISAISADVDHSCALTSGGGVKCWGNNTGGQLGSGTTANSLIPVDVSGLTSGVKGITVAGGMSCAVTTGGEAKCWGNGQLAPTVVAGLGSGVSVVALGYGTNGGTSCALAGGIVKCWSTSPATPATTVAGLPSGITTVSIAGALGCALTSGGGVKCWDIGYGSSGVPYDVLGLATGVLDVRVGYAGACALMSSGGVKCWGQNLGNGTKDTSKTPVDVVGLSGITAIAMDYLNSCAITNAHALKCWGYDYGTAPVDVPIAGSGL